MLCIPPSNPPLATDTPAPSPSPLPSASSLPFIGHVAAPPRPLRRPSAAPLPPFRGPVAALSRPRRRPSAAPSPPLSGLIAALQRPCCRPLRPRHRPSRPCRPSSAPQPPFPAPSSNRAAVTAELPSRPCHRAAELPSRRAAELPSRRAAELPSRQAAEPPCNRAAKPPSRHAAAAETPHVLTFDAKGRAVVFEVWVDDLQLFLQCDRADVLSLFDLTSGASPAPAADADATVRSQWATRDAAARLAVRHHLPTAERAHFSQYKSAKTLYDAVVARYSSPATAALSCLILPYLFPDLAAFPTVADLITHLRTSDTRYRAALPAEFCAKNPPPMYITLYYIVTWLPDTLRSVRDHFLSVFPTTLTVDLLEERL
ncbi:unnamed protein product [Closterium sp. NIES-65]|nr:unnamed protein product [Closterium sp. NIES-65]